MPTLSGTIADVTGTPIPPSDVAQVVVKAPAPRVAGGNPSQVITTTTIPVTVGANGALSVTLDPGVAVLVVRTFRSHDTFELRVTADMTTIREAIIETLGQLPELEQSQLVALAAQVREDAAEAHRMVAEANSTLDEMRATDTATGKARTDAQAASAAAATSEGKAKTSETNAKTSETNAKTSETNAAGSKTAAATSASNAASSETKAKTSETNAKTSETNAAGSATASANSAAAADTSRAAAEAAKVAAEAAKMNWRGTWSGSTAYTARDVVFYQGSSFWATANIASGQAAPPAGNWQMLASKGDPGANGSSAWADIQNKPSTFPPDTHKHPVGDINTPGTPLATTALFGDGWKVPPNTTYPPMPTAEAQAGTASTQSTVSAAVLKAGADAVVSARIQLVSAFPASPVTGVLYLKAE